MINMPDTKSSSVTDGYASKNQKTFRTCDDNTLIQVLPCNSCTSNNHGLKAK